MTKRQSCGRPHAAPGQGQKAVLHLDEHDADARVHARPAGVSGKSGMPGNEYADGIWEHDRDVGLLLKAVDDLGIANDTIVIYTTDNGPNMFSWPDAAMTPFRSEKDSNWEGAFRLPAMVPPNRENPLLEIFVRTG